MSRVGPLRVTRLGRVSGMVVWQRVVLPAEKGQEETEDLISTEWTHINAGSKDGFGEEEETEAAAAEAVVVRRMAALVLQVWARMAMVMQLVNGLDCTKKNGPAIPVIISLTKTTLPHSRR